jgi:hypothetical protein
MRYHIVGAAKKTPRMRAATKQVSRTVTRGLYFHFLYLYLSRVLLQSVM